MQDVEKYIGAKFGDLTVLGLDPEYVGKTYNSCHWILKCTCGKIISKAPSRVISGHIKSCGCRKTRTFYRHGYGNDRFYHSWWSMMQRCYNSDNHNYSRYGGRGICVCEEWHSLENFVSWAHSTYPNSEAKLTLDRIDNNRNYEPDNCRWATSKEQMNNRRNTKIIEIDGVTKSLSEWCEEYDMPVSVVYSRINTMGWNADKALSTPIQHFDERGELIEINGALKTIKEWCEMYHISRSTVYGRKRRGMDIVSAITLPTKR